MKVELKNVKHYPSMSEETVAFNATIYIDGKKAGEAENKGKGGPTSIYIHDSKLSKELDDYAKSLPDWNMGPVSEGRPDLVIQMNTEHLIDRMLLEHLDKKDADKMARKIAKIDAQEKARYTSAGYPIVIRLKTKEGHYRWTACKAPERAQDAVDQIASRHKETVVEWQMI